MPVRMHAREGFASIKVLSSGIAFGVLAVLAMSAGTATAQIGDGEPQCAIGLKFEPGPIVNGHQLQPTQREFDARMQLLQERARTRNMQGCAPLP
jgi:hypothetical protein